MTNHGQQVSATNKKTEQNRRHITRGLFQILPPTEQPWAEKAFGCLDRLLITCRRKWLRKNWLGTCMVFAWRHFAGNAISNYSIHPALWVIPANFLFAACLQPTSDQCPAGYLSPMVLVFETRMHGYESAQERGRLSAILWALPRGHWRCLGPLKKSKVLRCARNWQQWSKTRENQTTCLVPTHSHLGLRDFFFGW